MRYLQKFKIHIKIQESGRTKIFLLGIKKKEVSVLKQQFWALYLLRITFQISDKLIGVHIAIIQDFAPRYVANVERMSVKNR